MDEYYNNIIISNLKKKLQEEHRLEFKNALANKKSRIENYKNMANLNIEELKSEGIFSQKELEYPHVRELIQGLGKRHINEKHPFGWRGSTWRKDLLRKYNSFQVVIGNDIQQFHHLLQR